MAGCFLRLFPLLLAAALTACGQGGSSSAGGDSPARAFMAGHPRVTAATTQAADDDRFLHVITADRAETLDPHNTESGGDTKVIVQIYETLLRVDPENVDNLVPVLAQSWEVSAEGMTITFQMREGVTFHDGAKLDALAAKNSLDRLQGRYQDVPAAPYRSYFKFIEAIEADGMTLTVRLNRPVARVALRNLASFPASIVSPALLAATQGMDAGQRSTFISEWASGTGPFYLQQFDSADTLVRLGANEDYWAGAPAVKRAVFRQVTDPNSQLEYLRSGQADILDDVPRSVWQELETYPNIHLHRFWALNVCYLGVNVKHQATRDMRVRQAMRLAIDREGLLELYYGTARATYSIVAQPFAEYDPDYRPPGTEAPLAERLERARALVREAGAQGRAMSIYYPLNPRPYLPTPDKVADKIRQQLETVGLSVKIVGVPNKELFESVRHDRYELILIGWMTDNADPDNFYTPLTDGDGETGIPSPNNPGRTFDPEIHELIVQAQSMTDVQERVAAYRAIERIQQETQVGYVPLVNTQQGYAFGGRIEGVEVDPLGLYRLYKVTWRGE